MRTEEKTVMYVTECVSPIGRLTLASDGRCLTGLWIQGQKCFPDLSVRNPVFARELPVFLAARSWLERYFAGERTSPEELPLAPEGSEFRRLVWNCLCGIPYGTVTTYGALAKKAAGLLGKTSMSAQAIGGAAGHNPISVIIPCHRVVGTDGSLTGYAGGIDKKIKLLTLEGIPVKDGRVAYRPK